MRKFGLLALASLPISSAVAADDVERPTTVYVQNKDAKSAIVATCDVPVADGMHCHFTQMSVGKPDETKAQERIAKGAADMLKAPASEFKDCDKFAAFLEAVESGKAPPEVTDRKQFEADWAKEAPESKADTIRLMRAFASFCQTRDAASAEAVARAADELQGATCNISNWSFDKTFTQNYSTKRWQSTIQTNDSCGTIEYSEFAKPDDPKANYFWNYTTKSIVTNTNGKNIVGVACMATDQIEHRYTWQTGKFYANCKYIQMSP
ncbi:hypothetical protein [Mesorhizobium sp. M0030]|uniref:hypothetical protein n=1 Tax=Mesorhizobium sp. M0030 TaxID=2956851 RepID=UPI0033393D38